MAAIDTSKSYLVTGRLAYNVTDLGTAYPHGGTALGNVGSIFFLPPDGIIRLPACDSNETEAVLYTGGDSVLTASLEQWDNDALGVVFPSTTLQDSQAVIDFPEDEGETLAALTNLVFTPINQNHPSIILWNPVPHVQAQARMAFSARRWLSVPVAFIGLTNASGVSATVGILNALSIDPVTGFTATDGADGTADLAWTNPTGIRSANSIVIRRADGSTAPTSVTGGTGIYDGALKTSHTDTLDSDGTYSYSVFVGYDTTGDGLSDVYSPATSDTVAVTGTPPDRFLSAELIWWFDFSDSATVTTSGSEITQVTNKSPNSSSTLTPYATGTDGLDLAAAAVNGLDVAQGGLSKLLRNTSQDELPTGGAPFAVYAVIQLNDSPTATQTILKIGGTTVYTALRPTTDERFSANYVPSFNLQTAPAAITLGQPVMVALEQAANNDRTVEVDGGSTATDSTLANVPTTGSGTTSFGGLFTTAGAEYMVDDYLCEFFFTNAPLSASKLAELESYVSTKWGITFA